MATWGRHCDGLIFLSSATDVLLPTLVANGNVDRYDNLWFKMREGLYHLYKKYLDDYDFFLKADDDSYVVIENLRFVLASLLMSQVASFIQLNCDIHLLTAVVLVFRSR
jgi:glycoprotein-N-acetylgalactosamine 3-beta-galactosyltransferase